MAKFNAYGISDDGYEAILTSIERPVSLNENELRLAIGRVNLRFMAVKESQTGINAQGRKFPSLKELRDISERVVRHNGKIADHLTQAYEVRVEEDETRDETPEWIEPLFAAVKQAQQIGEEFVQSFEGRIKRGPDVNLAIREAVSSLADIYLCFVGREATAQSTDVDFEEREPTEFQDFAVACLVAFKHEANDGIYRTVANVMTELRNEGKNPGKRRTTSS